MRVVLKWFLIVLMALPLVAEARRASLFPLPEELKPDVRFWTRIYTEVTTQQGLIHDRKHLNIVYELVDIPPGISAKKRRALIKKRRERVENLLLDLANAQSIKFTDEHLRIRQLWPPGTDSKTFQMAKKDVRFQIGQADRFKEGIVRSGRWLSHIRRQFNEMGLPLELAALPHVESSFQVNAKSHAGASGMWQFMRGTGRRFLRIDHVVDERLDPFLATRAAGLLLKDNYEKTTTWPLALTAYNHGAAGMQRAIKKMGGTDLVPILRQYKGRTFGFASRNFYNAFIAANTIDRKPEDYFGPIQRDPPVQFETVKLPKYYTVKGLQQAFGLKSNIIKSMNPALKDPVWRTQKLVPKGYQLRLPVQSVKTSPALALAKVPRTEQSHEQRPDLSHRVRRGENLSSIAKKYRVRTRDLVTANNLRNRNHIWVGQMLKIPQQRTRPARYTVRKGDTLAVIAHRTKVSQSRLMALNGLKDKNRIYAGQRLRLR